jgi:hydroxymethylglutaryl-CoA reductase (NADPH)
MLRDGSVEELATRLAPRTPGQDPLPPRIPAGNDHTAAGLDKRRQLLAEQGLATEQLAGEGEEIAPEALASNIENLVGFARIPVGVAGPLRVNGTCAQGDFYVPLATSEGALVASCNRGAYLVSRSGGVSVACFTESVSRAPCFCFESLSDAGMFLAWLLPRFESLHEVVATTSRHCRLVDLRTAIVGREIHLIFDYTTGDASGQNMVTIATDAICRHLAEHAPVPPSHWYVEGNLSGDKKATMIAFTSARGKKVVAEATIPRRMLERFAHTTPEDMKRYWEISVLGGVQSGSIGAQGHYANALAAVFIACGQDAACVAEASVGVTRLDVTGDGGLYISVSMPNLIVGTVGGGTGLPTARECLSMIDCLGQDRARKFAEICAATTLAGEVSIIAALAAGDFARAHASYGRSRKAGS